MLNVNAPASKLESYSGQWNVQVVRGKVTTRCLWNACKALSLGLLLLLLGTTMAIVGYYADELSAGAEIRDNATVQVRYESRGFHLNNLSYAGPIVMGVGGFIVVAACVMTFEARDSAAKVVPARFKPSASVVVSSTRSTPRKPGRESRRTASCQTKSDSQSRRALTKVFLQQLSGNALKQHVLVDNHQMVSKSPSAPNLVEAGLLHPTMFKESLNLLSPRLLPRQALSMDCSPCVSSASLDIALPRSAQGSMALDLHQCNVTLTVKDESVGKKPQLLRQRPVDDSIRVNKTRVSTSNNQSLRLSLPSPSTQSRGHKTIVKSHSLRKSLEAAQYTPSVCTRHKSLCYSPTSTPQRTSCSGARGRSCFTDSKSCRGCRATQTRHEPLSSCVSCPTSEMSTRRRNSVTSCSGHKSRRPSPCRARSLSPSCCTSPQRKSSIPHKQLSPTSPSTPSHCSPSPSGSKFLKN